LERCIKNRLSSAGKATPYRTPLSRVCVGKKLRFDFNGAAGKLIASVLFAVAEMEQETRRERQRVGIEAAKERGVYRGRKPDSTKAKPARAKRLREKGLTLDEIASSIGVSRVTVCRYLKT
jgi:DNA invertase Pin-like site-specific DNA recombinase